MVAKRTLLGVLGAGCVALLGLKWWLLDTPQAAGAPYALDTSALHRLAVEAGDLPDHIEVEELGAFAFPRSLVVAGEGFSLHPMVLLAHRVVWKDGRSLVIDTGMLPEKLEGLPGARVVPGAHGRLLRALHAADQIVVTHEHPDHLGGVAALSANAADQAKLLLSSEQLGSKQSDRDSYPYPAGLLEGVRPLDYQGPHRVAPGVVLQHAPGHTVGSQLIFVETRDGTQFLFVGDIAWTRDNITEQRGRPRIAELMMHEDRAAVAAQLEALHAVARDVHLIIAHDRSDYEGTLASGLVRKGFSF